MRNHPVDQQKAVKTWKCLLCFIQSLNYLRVCQNFANMTGPLVYLSSTNLHSLF